MNVRLLKIAENLVVPFESLPLKLVKKNKFNQLLYSASTNKGHRLENEDYYKITEHPLDSDVLMIVVSDGVGGYSAGEVASLFISEKLSLFFRSLTLEEINNTQLFCLKLRDELHNINEEMLKNAYYVGEATLSCAVINENDIIICQVGDSRIYTYNGDKLKQVTEDESEVWSLYKDGLVLKEDLRFISGNNIITNALGDSLYNPAQINVLNKYACEALLLTTDGVTDILSDKTLNQIFREMFILNPEEITDIIVKEATSGKKETVNEEIIERICDSDRYPMDETNPGKDNATAVLTLVPKKSKKII